MTWPASLLTLALCPCSATRSHPDDRPPLPAATSRVSTANGKRPRGRWTESHPPTRHRLSPKPPRNDPRQATNRTTTTPRKNRPCRAEPGYIKTPEPQIAHGNWTPQNDRNRLPSRDRSHSLNSLSNSSSISSSDFDFPAGRPAPKHTRPMVAKPMPPTAHSQSRLSCCMCGGLTSCNEFPAFTRAVDPSTGMGRTWGHTYAIDFFATQFAPRHLADSPALFSPTSTNAKSIA